jgi:signal transduction histidine kinase
MTHRAAELGAVVNIGDLPSIESDRLAVEQIFANLIDNALKYGRDDAALHIDVNGRTTASHAIFDVSDTGRGIAPQDQARVFELFRRAGRQDQPGEGMGLAHVRAQVRRLGGTMALRSELAMGSTFTVSLPLRWSIERTAA